MLQSVDIAHQMALHQGGIEQIFLDSMASNGVEVERPMIPTSIELSEDQSALKNPKSHPVKVSRKSYDLYSVVTIV